jgi:transcriptional regulator with XRE-family HTH domain
MGFKERLKAERHRQHLTQQELASRIKTKNTSISNWEQGVSVPAASMVQLLADALGVTPFELLDDYTLHDLQELQKKEPETLSVEEELALAFATDLLKQAAKQIGDSVAQFNDEWQKTAADVARGFAELAPAMQVAVKQRLYADGGEDVLWGYQFLNRDAKALLIDYLCGLLRVPSMVDMEEVLGGEERQIQTLLSIKEQLKGGR